MNRTDPLPSRSRPRVAVLLALAAACGAVVLAQQNATQPQPQPNRLPAVGAARPSRGNNVAKPADAAPKVPAGFTVSQYAEIQAPRLMVYAPNGDLFVSSPATNSITVLRDANNDGQFEARS